jgi:hypothetical protein
VEPAVAVPVAPDQPHQPLVVRTVLAVAAQVLAPRAREPLAQVA